MTNNKIKVAKIVLFVSLIICVVFAITLIVSSVKLDYAEEHYYSNKQRIETTNDYFQDKKNGYFDQTYSCGERECEYCNGVKSIDHYSNLVFYKTYYNLKISSIAILSLSGALLISSSIYLVNFNKKRCKNEK